MRSLVKVFIIIVIFAGAMAALLSIKGNAMTGKRVHKMVFIETADDWRKCKLDDAQIIENENTVAFGRGPGQVQLTTFPIDPGFDFTRLILSWNSSKPESLCALNFMVDVSPDLKNWTRFEYITYGILGEGQPAQMEFPPTEIKDIGKVDVDNLILTEPMRYAKVTVQSVSGNQSGNNKLRRLSLSFSADNSTWKEYSHSQKAIITIGKVKLAVPYFSQRNLPSSISGNCCSPTSVSMVLNYFGRLVDPEIMAHRVYDPAHQIYGNWPFNAQAAYISGMGKTWVEVHSSFDELYDEVASGKPVIISISYGMNELPNSPIHEAPEGHLIAVIGFDGPNTVICNDPAGHNVEDGVVNYPRKELESIWLSHGGVAYHLWPE